MNNDKARRIGAMLMAFAGVILAAESPINWSDPQFWAAVIMVIVPAFLNSTDKLPSRSKKV